MYRRPSAFQGQRSPEKALLLWFAVSFIRNFLPSRMIALKLLMILPSLARHACVWNKYTCLCVFARFEWMSSIAKQFASQPVNLLSIDFCSWKRVYHCVTSPCVSKIFEQICTGRRELHMSNIWAQTEEHLGCWIVFYWQWLHLILSATRNPPGL